MLSKAPLFDMTGMKERVITCYVEHLIVMLLG